MEIDYEVIAEDEEVSRLQVKIGSIQITRSQSKTAFVEAFKSEFRTQEEQSGRQVSVVNMEIAEIEVVVKPRTTTTPTTSLAPEVALAPTASPDESKSDSDPVESDTDPSTTPAPASSVGTEHNQHDDKDSMTTSNTESSAIQHSAQDEQNFKNSTAATKEEEPDGSTSVVVFILVGCLTLVCLCFRLAMNWLRRKVPKYHEGDCLWLSGVAVERNNQQLKNVKDLEAGLEKQGEIPETHPTLLDSTFQRDSTKTDMKPLSTLQKKHGVSESVTSVSTACVSTASISTTSVSTVGADIPVEPHLDVQLEGLSEDLPEVALALPAPWPQEWGRDIVENDPQCRSGMWQSESELPASEETVA